MDKYLLVAFKQYKCEIETDPVDQLLVEASQRFEASLLPVPPPLPDNRGCFGAPCSSEDVKRVKNSQVLKKTRANTA